ncbi:MAG: ABC transporter permease [Dehalococcoidia bacterium]|nr:ABC transporter permease [Dehalococcoidia bacterium]
MGAYVVRRLMWTPVLLIAVSLMTFTLGRFGPGDPVQIWMGQYNNPEVAERLRQQYGLDRPFFVQYGIYVKDALQGDLGESFQYRGRGVSELLKSRMWISLQLNVAAMIIAVGLGVPLGFFTALKQGTWLDTATVSVTLLFMSVPVFLTAPGMLIIFALWLDLLPTHGWGGFFDQRIIMPALVMGIPGVAFLTRLTRASTLEVLSQEYVRTARAKGLNEFAVGHRHILRNALIPIFTMLGLSLATLMTGTFIVEGFFGIPGMGRLAIESFFARDYPIIMALTLIIAAAFVLANLLVDIGYRFIDPRIRY